MGNMGLPADGKQNTALSPIFTQPGKSLLEIPCMEFHVTQALTTFSRPMRQSDRNRTGCDGEVHFHVRVTGYVRPGYFRAIASMTKKGSGAHDLNSK